MRTLLRAQDLQTLSLSRPLAGSVDRDVSCKYICMHACKHALCFDEEVYLKYACMTRPASASWIRNGSVCFVCMHRVYACMHACMQQRSPKLCSKVGLHV